MASKKKIFHLHLAAVLVSFTSACTNFLVTPKASSDGSAMIGYNADSHLLYGALYHYPRATHPSGSMRKVFDWETGNYLGEIPEAPVTYNVVGNTNEFAVTIGETTFGGRPELASQPGAKIDYGSLIWITLQRSRNASEAIHIMTTLVAAYGYASTGESFSIADPTSVWILEMISTGPGRLGAVWAAVKLPDGSVSGHANQARIQRLDLLQQQGAETLSSPDMISFAISKGWWRPEYPANTFSFSDVYDPVTFLGVRFCEARVWAGFSYVLSLTSTEGPPSPQRPSFEQEYYPYISGANLSHRMPLFITPPPGVLITLNTTITLMGLHDDATALRFDNDVSAGPFGAPYRWRPLTWQADAPSAGARAEATQKQFFNERSAGTQQTGWSFVSQMRSRFAYSASGATSLGSVLWFAVDDSSTSAYVPMYCNISAVPPAYSNNTNSAEQLMTYDRDAAFWVFNLVSNWVYTRWSSMYPIVQRRKDDWLSRLALGVADIDRRASSMPVEDVVALTTQFSSAMAAAVIADWQALFGQLFTGFMDGNVKASVPGAYLPSLSQPGYGQKWYNMVARETGTRYEVPSSLSVPRANATQCLETVKLRALRSYL